MKSSALLVMALVLLQGCTSSGSDVGTDVASVGVGTAVGALTGNPFIGLGAGLATRVALGEAVDYGERQYYGAIQTAIAEAAGDLELGSSGNWTFEGPGGVAGAAGEVEVVRRFGLRTPCREIIYTLEDEDDVFVGVICKGADGWRWAVSKPSTHRWGGLQ